jgi:hypothetical protein
VTLSVTVQATNRRTGEAVVHEAAPLVLKPLFGTNKGGFGEMQNAIGRHLRGYRGYQYPQDTAIPAAWPGADAGPIPRSITAVISLTAPNVDGLADVAGVIDGKYDSHLAAYFAKVPSSALVTMGAEYEDDHFPYAPAQILAMHERVHPIFKRHAALGSRYGWCCSSYTESKHSSHYPLAQWVPPGLDFYAIDGYQGNFSETVSSVLAPCLKAIRSVEPEAIPAVFETNAYIPAARPAWFTNAYAWAKDTGCLTFLPFWGAAPYNWQAGDTETIATLAAINADSQT